MIFGERLVEVELLIDQTGQTLAQMISGKQAQEQIAAQMASAQAEQTRVNSIKERINNIKAVLMDALEVPESKGFEALINAVNAVDVNTENFAEFVGEAQAAKDAAIKSLQRQRDAMVFEEKAEAEANAQQVNEVKPQVTESESVNPAIHSVNHTQNQVGQSQSSLTLLPPALEQEFGKQFIDGLDDDLAPPRVSLIKDIAFLRKVSEATAEQWLITRFGAMEKAA